MNTDKINSREEFIVFAKALYNDYKEHGENWENNTLDTFLERIAAYAEDIDGYYSNKGLKEDPEKASWKLFADILAGATIYE